MSLRSPRLTSLSVAVLVAACAARPIAPPAPPVVVFPFTTDTNRVRMIERGVAYRYVYAPSGPWAIHVLDVDLTQCNTAVAVKGSEIAAGRTKTSALLTDLRATRDVVGGVNADFFSLTNGTPTGLLVVGGRVVTGPSTQPVLAIDSSGAPHTVVFRVSGTLAPPATFPVTDWNHTPVTGLALFDDAWGPKTDTATSVIEVVLGGRDRSRVMLVDTATAGVAIPRGGAVLVAGKATDPAIRAALLRLQSNDVLIPTAALAPFHPRDAVGGRPMLLRDSVVVPEIETEGQASFRARNPRTAAGIARGGRRLMLVVVDGRQKGYSDGMTLRELADLMLAMGARDAINLDGGGSSTLLYADAQTPGGLRVANSTSDTLPTGQHVERAVGDALAIVHGSKPTDHLACRF